jgi:hypothetical protein
VNAATIISLSISAISLIIAAYIGVRQYIIQRSSNSVSANFEILRQVQEPGFHDSFEFVVEKLREYSPEAGLRGLPVDVRNKIRNVCYFFQHIAMLMFLDLIDEQAFTAYFRARTVAAWEAVEPFVKKEREVNHSTGPEFLTLFEAFAIKANRTTPEVAKDLLEEWLARPADGRRMRHTIKQVIMQSKVLARTGTPEPKSKPNVGSD